VHWKQRPTKAKTVVKKKQLDITIISGGKEENKQESPQAK